MSIIVRHRNPFCMSEVKRSTFGQSLTAVSRQTFAQFSHKKNNVSKKEESNLVRRSIQRVKVLLILD